MTAAASFSGHLLVVTEPLAAAWIARALRNEARRSGQALPAAALDVIDAADAMAARAVAAQVQVSVQSPDVGGSEPGVWLSTDMTARRLGVSGSAVARRARSLLESGRARRAADSWSWEIEEEAVQEWERQRMQRGAA